MINVFAYGSNMCTERIRARVTSAVPVTVGYVTQRRLVFHKRGADGSAKADAVYTGCDDHRLWGVVFSVKRDQVPQLDVYESGYEPSRVLVTGQRGPLTARIYIARAESIDVSLKPFAWYHRFVLHGAQQHQLPLDYVKQLQAIEFIADPDGERDHHNSQLIVSDEFP